MSGAALDIVILLIAIGLAWALTCLGQALWTVDPAAPAVRVSGRYSPVLTWLRYRRLPRLIWQPAAWDSARPRVWLAAEIAVIALWAAGFGQVYLNLNPRVLPTGDEFAMSIQSNYIWTLLGRCGACLFWNGFTNGGVPAFVDLHGAPLHPLVILTTLLLGPVNGAKLTVLACLALAGLAQWWLAQTLRLGRLARLWSAGLAVVGGAVAGRMQFGLVPLALSVAMSALVIAGCVHLALTGLRRAAIGLGVLLALLALSGQGYLQIGLALSLLPALALLLLDQHFLLAPVWKEFVLAGGLAVLLSAALWVPVAHFLPNLAKDTDPNFQSAQTLGATVLNLVIGDTDFYENTSLGKQPYPYLYVNYLGWVPVLLAFGALRLVPRTGRRLLAFFLAAVSLIFLTASAVTLRGLALVAPGLAAEVRNPAPIATLAAPLVLALAAWGLDRLTRLNWPRLRLPLGLAAPGTVTLSSAWLVLALPLAWSLKSAYDFDQFWLGANRLPASMYALVASLRQLVPEGQTEWVQPPWGDNAWLTPAMDAGLKIASYFRPWHWDRRLYPLPFAEAVHPSASAATVDHRGTTSGFNLLAHPDRQYAAVATPAGLVPCRATAAGGDIDVTCVTAQPGELLVEEHFWTGWFVQLDGLPASLTPDEWLATAAPAGQHTFTFRYRPWDVPLGLALTLAGLALAVLLWRRASTQAPSQIAADLWLG